jgi:Right handed beta helix region
MQKYKSFGAAITVASALFAISAPAHAQATRTWVAGVGDDLNPCSRTAPCKTFAGAMPKTAVNGIINCVDNGAYGSVTIVKSITIDCHETLASILASQDGVNGININIPTGDPKDTQRTVRLRNIDIQGVGAGNAGVNILQAAAVIMEDMSIAGFVKQGIVDSRTEGGTMLAVKNSIVANNPGVGFAMGAKENSVTLDNVHSIKNAYGLAVAKGNNVQVSRSVFTNNTTAGLQADSGAQIEVDNSVVSYNATGLLSGGGTIGFANTDVTFNTIALAGTTTTFGNNRLFANGAVGPAPIPAGASSPALGQQ